MAPVIRSTKSLKSRITAGVTQLQAKSSTPTRKPVAERVDDSVRFSAVKGAKPKMYFTMSAIGLMMATVRSHDNYTVDYLYDYIPGMEQELAAYGIGLPHDKVSEFAHTAFKSEWEDAYSAIRAFYNEFGLELKNKLNKDASVSAEMKSIADTFLQMIAARDPARWGKLETTAVNKFRYLKNPIVEQAWRIDVTSEGHNEGLAALADLIRPIVGDKVDNETLAARDRYTLSTEQKDKLRKDQPDLLQKYNKLYNGMIKDYRNALRNHILDKGGSPIPVGKARKAVEDEGFVIHELPKELDTLFVGADGFYYTSAGRKIVQRPQPGTKILGFNPNYDPDDEAGESNWIFQYKTDEGDPIHAYTEAFKQNSKKEKFDHIADVLDDVPAMRPKWVADIKSTNNEKSMRALVTDVLYVCAARIGGDGYVKNFGTTYGISTLKVEHVKVKPATVTLDYHGKDAKRQVHVLNMSDRDEKLLAVKITALVKGKKPDDHLFTYADGKPVTAPHVRAYMKSIGIPVNPHGFRSVKGTRYMRDHMATSAMQKKVKALDQTGAEKLFKNEALAVGKMLGHVRGSEATSATAIGSYIAPWFMQNWFKEHGFRIPLWAKADGAE